MSINSNYSALTKLTTRIINPNGRLGIILEEVPSDIGRSVAGYKRGGFIEFAEKMRRELMSAAVWLGGIPFFKFLGDKLFEKIFHVPMKMDFSSTNEGNDAIGDTLRYVFKNENPERLNVSEITKKYKDKFVNFANGHADKFKRLSDGTIDIADLAKKVSTGKKITATIAIILNCLMMGVILPKINQKITRNLLKKQQKEQYSPKFASMKEFQKNNKNDKNINFTGFFSGLANDISKNGLSYTIGYRTENDNTFRLISTDIPMIIGRVGTSRNKYEGIENGYMDATSIFFYNFCSGIVQRGLRKLTGIGKQMPIPDIKPAVSESLSKVDSDVLKNAFESLNNNQSVNSISDILPRDVVNKLYKAGTFGKFGYINKFVKRSDLAEIDKSVFDFMKYIDINQSATDPLFKENRININLVKKLTSNVNKANAVMLGLGLLSSIIGLAIIVPKTTFWITKQLTGRNEFTGIAKYDDLEKNKKHKNTNDTAKA